MRKLTLKTQIEVSPDQILDCQTQMGIIFPENYKEFLSINNGIHPLECNFKKEEGWILSLNFLYCISELEDRSLLYISQMYYSKFMSRHFLPFGDDGDWIFVISLREHDYNKIYIYRTDEDEDERLIYLEELLYVFVEKLLPDSAIN